jgi:hypothetical protein
MGYSIYVVMPTEDKMNEAYDLLMSKYRRMQKQTALRIAKGTDGRAGLSYADDQHHYAVGFDYASWMSETERAYSLTILVAMADVYELGGYWYDGSEFVTGTDWGPDYTEEILRHSVLPFKEGYLERIRDYIQARVTKMFTNEEPAHLHFDFWLNDIDAENLFSCIQHDITRCYADIAGIRKRGTPTKEEKEWFEKRIVYLKELKKKLKHKRES